MNKQSTLYHLMGMRMNGIMNEITEQDEAMKLIDRYVNEYNAIGSRYGMLAYMLVFSDCQKLFLDLARPGKEALADGLL